MQPVGQMPYESMDTKSLEYGPVAGTLVAARESQFNPAHT